MKVGYYVRTKNGVIFKIIGGNEDNWDLDISFGYLETFEENWLELYRYNDNHSFFNDSNIIKSSPNIIDLIEVGDIVKYNPVMNGYIKKQTFCKLIKDVRDLLYFKYQIEHKKANFISIVTKEQFESMEYKVR